ncbi:MAG: DsbA family protein [Thermomicrobiales bacterium]|nr:DsbA family protein [Thermomicrobiales bacterium]
MKITVWIDFVCPYAWTAQRWLFDLQKELGDDLEITWRYFSIEQVNKAEDAPNVWEHPNDGSSSTMRAFQGAHAAGKQGADKYLAYMAALYNQRHINKRNLGTQQILEETAVQVGLDLDQFREDLKSDEVFEIFKNDHTEAVEKYGIFGVPTILFENGQSAYLRIKIGEPPVDPVAFWDEFVAIVRDRPTILEIKRPTPPSA